MGRRYEDRNVRGSFNFTLILRGPFEVRERFSDFIPYWLR